MASQAVSKVMEAEENAGRLLENAHNAAKAVMDSSRAEAERVRADIIEQANAYSADADRRIAERYEYAALDANKRAAAETERIKNAYSENRERVISALTDALFAE